MKLWILLLLSIGCLTLVGCKDTSIKQLYCIKGNEELHYYYDDEGVLDITSNDETPNFNSGYIEIEVKLNDYLDNEQETLEQSGYSCEIIQTDY